MMEFKEDKATISELRKLLGKRCQRRTIRGWIYVGIIKAIELKDDETIVIANTDVRGSRDTRFPLHQCRLDSNDKGREAVEKEDRVDKKERKLKEVDAKSKAIQDKIDLMKKLGDLSQFLKDSQ